MTAILIMNKEHELHELSNTTNEKIIYKDLSFGIMEAVFEVHNTLVPGYSLCLYSCNLLISAIRVQ